ncbi:hypothetical protein GCM10025858_38610 [Alicyclobacillus sacchari]|uniref:hypothetical protein n=1 Tax=Alicyclobacillus sacchari TaxID=392010 RepID=UPI0023E921D9|nr:hypothetical protein [Alicyclobacillus sacchari]GMA59358.1 hypothetical protein GCM10025858_38610 [Alicyclobacillus sacchari]
MKASHFICVSLGIAFSALCPAVVMADTSTSNIPNSQVTLTASQEATAEAQQQKIVNLINSSGSNTSNVTTGMLSPDSMPDYGPATPSYTVSTGTMTEPDAGTTCGPIAAYNLLYNIPHSSRPSVSTLKSQLGWTNSAGTGYGSNWTSTLNSDQSYHTYSLSPVDPSVTDVYDDTIYAVGYEQHVPDILDIYGYIPGYQSSGPNYLYHYVTYDSYNVSTDTMGWYDESDLNANGHNVSYTVSELNSLNSGSSTSLHFQGVVY